MAAGRTPCPLHHAHRQHLVAAGGVRSPGLPEPLQDQAGGPASDLLRVLGDGAHRRRQRFGHGEVAEGHERHGAVLQRRDEQHAGPRVRREDGARRIIGLHQFRHGALGGATVDDPQADEVSRGRQPGPAQRAQVLPQARASGRKIQAIAHEGDPAVALLLEVGHGHPGPGRIVVPDRVGGQPRGRSVDEHHRHGGRLVGQV
jgi:hypothetical protein